MPGQQDLSRQSIERGTGVDEIVMQDLAAAYWTTVDSAILNADGTLGTHLGIRSTVGIVAVTYTSASPTAVELWPKLGDALQQVQTGSYAGATHFLMHPRRFYWLASRTGTDRPFLAVEGAGDQGGTVGGTDYFATNRSVLGVPIVVDGNIPTNISSTQDVILVVSAPELHFWDDGVQFIRAEQVLAATLQIKLVLFGYSAFTAGRLPAAHGTIGGTRTTTPVFSAVLGDSGRLSDMPARATGMSDLPAVGSPVRLAPHRGPWKVRPASLDLLVSIDEPRWRTTVRVVAVWASDSFDGIPAGTVHRNDDDDEYGRPNGPVCGARGRLFYFASRTVDDVPPAWRCPDCSAPGAD
jgi:Phage capsid family